LDLLADPALEHASPAADSGELRWTPQASFTGSTGTLHLLGLVTNEGDQSASSPWITAILLGPNQEELVVKRGISHKSCIEPGETVAVQIQMADPPESTEIRFEVAGRGNLWCSPIATGLSLEQRPVQPGTFGGWQLQGKVINGGAVAVEFARIDVYAYEGDELVGIGFGFADSRRIEPGQYARYDISLRSVAREPTRFDLIVSGRPAKD
jgi:hypothetical protein